MKKDVTKKAKPSWSYVKAKLSGFDDAGMLALVHDLYSSSKENQDFLHTRFGLGAETLKPYKVTIARWLWPDISKGQDVSVSRAKKAISDYKKAVGRPEDLAELMIFYCEQASGFCDDVGFSDENFFVSLMNVFIQTLKLANTLPPTQREILLVRLDEVSRVSHKFGYGLGDEMDDLLDEHSIED